MARDVRVAAGAKEVGRGRPPEHSRFQKGVSGNPRGRPPKNRNLKKLVEEELDQSVSLTENGKRVRLTKRELIAKMLVNDAAKGDQKALQTIVKLIGVSSEPDNPVVDVDPAALARFVARYLSQEPCGEMSELPEAVYDEMTRVDYATFVARVMDTLEPGTRYEHNWHIDLIAHRLAQVSGGSTKRLMINLPPRSMKTILISVAYSAWVLGQNPSRRIMCVAYSKEVAQAQGVQFNRIVNSAWFRRVFPKCRPVVPNRVLEWITSTGGYRLSTSIDGSVLGRGADIIILDDPNKGQEIYSKVSRDKVKNGYNHTISTRLNHPKESAIICVMQRLHDDDLAGHMQSQEEWDTVVVSAIAVQDELWQLGFGETHERKAGDLIQASRMGHDELDTRRRIMGQTAFDAQYQQRPIPDDGIVIRKGWLRYYEEPAERYEVKVASWDTASTLSENSDWSVCTVWGLVDAELHLLHVERVQLEAPELIRRIEQIHCRHQIVITLIEDADLGRGLAQHLNRASSVCRPRLIKPTIEKVARMQARSVMFETGKVFLPHGASWLSTYLDELLGFPNRVHDDQVDSTSQALDYFQLRFASAVNPERSEFKPARPNGIRRPQGRKRP